MMPGQWRTKDARGMNGTPGGIAHAASLHGESRLRFDDRTPDPQVRRPIEAQEVTGSCVGGVADRGTQQHRAACGPALGE